MINFVQTEREEKLPLQITKYKGLVPYGTQPNSTFGGTSFILEPVNGDLSLFQNFGKK